MTTVGILGGGQLGRMMALAGMKLGIKSRVFDPSPEACAGQITEHVQGSFEDVAALARFCQDIDVATYEWENVPVEAAQLVAGKVAHFFPAPSVLKTVQDRFLQKEFLRELGIPTAPYQSVSSRTELGLAVNALGLPTVLKTRRMGYDGKGQFVVRALAEVETAWAKLGATPLLAEAFIAFERELSIVSVRGRTGETAFYPVAENQHRDGILRVSTAPAPGLSAALQSRAEGHARRILDALKYVGVLSLEFFEHRGELLVNEIATRVHNSGHWTMDGAVTSQFENHLRAVTGMPLGATSLREPTVMVNFIGTVPDTKALSAIAGCKLHLYGKRPAPGRKLGHVNAPASRLKALLALIA